MISSNVRERQKEYFGIAKYFDEVLRGLRFGIGIVLAIMGVWVACTYLCPDIVESGIVYIISRSTNGAILSTHSPSGLSPETIYEATIAYYNQIISILIFVIGIAGVIAFAHIGLISRERAEDIAKESAEKRVNGYFETIVFQDYTTKKLEYIIDQNFGLSLEAIGDINKKLDIHDRDLLELSKKYDRHDDMLREERERELANQKVDEDKGSDEEKI